MLFRFIILLILCPIFAQALELQAPSRNMDKRSFRSFPSMEKNEGNYNLYTELGYIKDPLVSEGNFSGNLKPLISGLMMVEVGGNWFITDNFSVGMALPMVKAQGATESSSMMLWGPAFELRYKFLDKFMIVPYYQLGSSTVIKETIGGNTYELPLGAKNGIVGGKLVYDIGKFFGVNFISSAGMYQAPENKFLNLDESSHTVVSVGASYPLGDKLKAVGELIVDKTPSQNIVDGYGYLAYQTSSFSIQTGAGADMTQSGANGLKAFFSLTFNFGAKESSSGYDFPFGSGKRIEPKDFPKFDNRKNPNNQRQEGEMDVDQTGPMVLEPEEAPAKETLKNPEETMEENPIYKQEQEVEDETK